MSLFITGIIKILIGFIGVLGTIFFAILAVFKRTRKGKLQYAGSTLLTTVIIILLITGFEFLMHPTNSKLDQLVLTGYREAPIGAYWLGVYDDSTWELGYSSREIKFSGTYTVSRDTLHLKTLGGTAFYNGDTWNSLVIDDDNLVKVENTGIGSLEIGINKLNEQ